MKGVENRGKTVITILHLTPSIRAHFSPSLPKTTKAARRRRPCAKLRRCGGCWKPVEMTPYLVYGAGNALRRVR